MYTYVAHEVNREVCDLDMNEFFYIPIENTPFQN